MRILCVMLPNFPLRCEFERHPEIKKESAAVVYAAGSQKLLLDFSPELEGLLRDMTLQEALALHGNIDLLDADLPYYGFIFNEILDRLEFKSPEVEGADLGCAYLGLDGMQLIYPDDMALTESVKEAIPAAFAVQMGIGNGKFPAYLAARQSAACSYRVLTGDLTSLLKDLPCDVLPVSVKDKRKLHEFGIHTLGKLAAVPPGPLQSQFGPEGKKIRELACGFDDTPLYPRLPDELIEESTALTSVTVSLEALLVTVESLLARVFLKETLRGKGIRSLTLWSRTWDAAHWERTIHFKEPTVDIKGTMPRIRLFLENFPQPGPVEQMGIKIIRLGYGSKRQKSLFSEVRAHDHLLEDIKQLEFRLGDPRVFKIKEVEPWSRIPERRHALTPVNQ